MRVLIAIALVALSLPACAQVVDNFDAGVGAWSPEMPYGKVDGCRISADAGALRADVDFGADGTNHIIYSKRVSLDLRYADGLAFDVKGTGDNVKVFLFLWDGAGHHVAYGPHGTNTDFRTGYADWHTCRLDLDADRPAEGGGVDLSDIQRIGFMLNQDGARKGTAWFDNLAAFEGRCKLKLSNNQISPNGDGFRDNTEITAIAPAGTLMDLKVYSSAGKLLSTIVKDYPMDFRHAEFTWNGTRLMRPLPDGRYILRAEFKGEQTTITKATVALQTVPKLPPIKFAAKPFFPIGVWFEGNPKWGGYPSTVQGAKLYYDRSFADLAAHGFNAVAVPNCPEQLWETLLQSAQKRGIKVVLEIPSLAVLIGPDPLTEGQVYAVAKKVVSRLSKYDSLLRYQVRDEPPPQAVPNWLLVQRVLAALDPKRPAFSCFCSRDALAAVAGQTTLSEAVFDIYPLGAGAAPQALGGFLGALDAFGEASGANVKWPVLQSFAKPGAWRYPSPEELRAMTYLALTTGAKGMFYFLYQSMPNHPEKLEGLVDARGRPTAMYQPASDLARELKKLSPLLMALGPGRGVYAIEGDVRMGSFTDRLGRPVLIIASTQPGSEVTAKVSAVPDGTWRDQVTGEEFTSTGGALQVPLGPGRGRVLVKNAP